MLVEGRWSDMWKEEEEEEEEGQKISLREINTKIKIKR